MSDLVTYQLNDSIANITMDDGKVNVLSPKMLAEINAALDQAIADRAVVVLTGREGMFSAGFDLRVLTAGGPDALAMLFGGFELAERILSSQRRSSSPATATRWRWVCSFCCRAITGLARPGPTELPRMRWRSA